MSRFLALSYLELEFSSEIVVKPIKKVMISFILNEIAWNEVENMKIHYTWLVNPVCHPEGMEWPPSLVPDVVTDDATHARKV